MPVTGPLKVTVLETKPVCPQCNQLLNMASSLEGLSPSPGDVSICIQCGCVLEFTEQMQFIKLPMEEVHKRHKEGVLADKAYKVILTSVKFIQTRVN